MNALQYAVREDHEETIAYLRAAMEEAGLSTTPQEEERPPSPYMIASRYPTRCPVMGHCVLIVATDCWNSRCSTHDCAALHRHE